MFDAQWIPAVFPIRHPALVFRNATSVSSCSLAQIPADRRNPGAHRHQSRWPRDISGWGPWCYGS